MAMFGNPKCSRCGRRFPRPDPDRHWNVVALGVVGMVCLKCKFEMAAALWIATQDAPLTMDRGPVYRGFAEDGEMIIEISFDDAHQAYLFAKQLAIARSR